MGGTFNDIGSVQPGGGLVLDSTDDTQTNEGVLGGIGSWRSVKGSRSPTCSPAKTSACGTTTPTTP